MENNYNKKWKAFLEGLNEEEKKYHEQLKDDEFEKSMFSDKELYEIEKRFDFEVPTLSEMFRKSFSTSLMLQAKGDVVNSTKFNDIADEYFQSFENSKKIRNKCENIRVLKANKK